MLMIMQMDRVHYIVKGQSIISLWFLVDLPAS